MPSPTRTSLDDLGPQPSSSRVNKASGSSISVGAWVKGGVALVCLIVAVVLIANWYGGSAPAAPRPDTPEEAAEMERFERETEERNRRIFGEAGPPPAG